jgi:uncharacterized membrane protein
LFSTLVAISAIGPFIVSAQEIITDSGEMFRARVIEISEPQKVDVPGTGVQSISQTVTAEITRGDRKGEQVTFENDYIALRENSRFFMYHYVDPVEETEWYSVRDIDRSFALLFCVVLFVATILIFSGKQGVRSILSLVGSFAVILFVLIPALLHGYPPMITSTAIAGVILFLAIYVTHGFNRESSVAFAGTILSVTITGLLASLSVKLAHLTGLASEEAFYLNQSTQGTLDFNGLLLGGVMIGILGVLDDIAVTQAAVVSELYSSAPNLSRREVYMRALRVGREHSGALVNTLALAYTGASLPLLLMFSSTAISPIMIVNKEVFTTEIIRTTIGSIGLILTVPITTLIAVYTLKGYKGKGHHHGHSHAHGHHHH